MNILAAPLKIEEALLQTLRSFNVGQTVLFLIALPNPSQLSLNLRFYVDKQLLFNSPRLFSVAGGQSAAVNQTIEGPSPQLVN